ncbi:hypothetical protein PCASD_26915, partial [Puccinia coronata f. sp. avenae]
HLTVLLRPKVAIQQRNIFTHAAYRILLRPPQATPLSAKNENLKPEKSDKPALQIFAEIILWGFELSIVSPKPLPRIECWRVNATIHPKFCHLKLTDCAISLASLNQTGSMEGFAYFVFDLFLSNQSPTWAFTHEASHDSPCEDVVEITADFQRIHAVAATSAFRVLLDCIQYLQFELARIKTTNPPPENNQSPNIIPPPQDFKGAALFISFTQLVTWSRLGQTSQDSVEMFAIQYLSHLDPSLVKHFENSTHKTQNSVFVPHLDVKFGLTARPQAPTLLAVKASAPSEITIDMSPFMLLIIHAFLDVYERDSHLIVNLLENQTQASHQDQQTVEPNISLPPTITDPWAIRVDFDTGVGEGGKIQLHTFDLAQDDANFIEIFQRANIFLGRVNMEVAQSDLFFLPGVLAWAVYHPISATNDSSSS